MYMKTKASAERETPKRRVLAQLQRTRFHLVRFLAMRIFGVCTGVWRKMGSHTPKGNFSSKRGNKNFYKGKGVKQYGKVTQYGTQKRKQKRKQKGEWAFSVGDAPSHLETRPACIAEPRLRILPILLFSPPPCQLAANASGRFPPPSKRICAVVCVLSSHWRVEFGRRLT